MRFSFKRTIRALLIFLVIPPIALVLIVALPNHIFNLVSLFNIKVSDEEVSILTSLPEAPLPGDDAFDKVIGIANQIDEAVGKTMKERNCFRRWSSDSFDPGCMALLETQADKLKAFDEWLAGPSPFKLERPKDLGRHGRFLLREFTVDSPIPNLLPFLSFPKLLALRSLNMMKMGRMADAEQDLRTTFALGSFLQQNPLLVAQVISWNNIRGLGIWLIVRHLGGGSFGEGFETMLPEMENDVEMFRWAMRLEGLPVYDVFYKKNEWKVWPFKLMGLYNRDLTWKFYLSKRCLALDHLDEGRLGHSFWEGYYQSGCKTPEGHIELIEWLPNRYGRALICGSENVKFFSKLGQAIDRVEATRIVIAARRFRQERAFWPTQEADLVPKYIRGWPKSALDGQPIRWLDNRSGVRILALDGKSFCSNRGLDLCEFPFEPPQPLGTR